MQNHRPDVKFKVADPSINMYAHAGSKNPEIPGHRSADFTTALNQKIFFKPFKEPFNSGAALKVRFPLRGISGDASEITEVILLTGIKNPAIFRFGARVVTLNIPLFTGFGAAPLVPLAVFAVTVVSHDMAGRALGDAVHRERELTLTRDIARVALVQVNNGAKIMVVEKLIDRISIMG